MAGCSWIRGKLIGTGAFSQVSLAMNREDGEVFAVKSVEVNGNDASANCSMLAIENEIQLLQSLDSKYVVRCLGSDWTEEGGKLMRNVFLEYMPEGSLADFLKQFAGAGALDEHLIRTYTRSIVEGIDYLHREGIVHCDIKGKNLLVRNGNVKLTDFGSAKRVGTEIESEAMNCSAKVNGTPLWMAPEVVRQVEQGLASDIWSLGCTVVEMATGRAPWSNLSNPFVALYHIGCTDELPEVPASLSAEAHDFLGKCFQRDPRKRWTSSQLLQHPFLTTRFVAKAAPTVEAPLSPCSVMQFPNSDLSSSFEDSIPILSTPSFLKRGLVSSQKSSQEQSGENCWGSSPFGDCAGEWIVVRSPKGSPSLSPSPFSNSMAPAVKCSVSTPEVAISEEKRSVLTSDNTVSISTATPTTPPQEFPGAHVTSTESQLFVGFEVFGESRVAIHYEDSSEEFSSAEEATTPCTGFQHEMEHGLANSEVDNISFWMLKQNHLVCVWHYSSVAPHQHLKREEFRRNQLHWITIAYIDWKASYSNRYCTLVAHLYNSYSPSWVTLPFNFVSVSCVISFPCLIIFLDWLVFPHLLCFPFLFFSQVSLLPSSKL